MRLNRNFVNVKTDRTVLFIDMNSFFASCEQQSNYWLRGRPVGVCVYTGRYGCIISPSIEAKNKGIKLGQRLDEAIRICPDLVPLESNPERYRTIHKKIMNVLKKYAAEVVPKSIDEAFVDISDYKLLYKDPVELARTIKADINTEAGDWLKCSIGIAPNVFLAKLASDIKKPDGLTVINRENIDAVLKTLKLEDLPGIASQMAAKFRAVGIQDPLQLRHANPETLKLVCGGVTGLYWHYRLNFSEVDMMTRNYQSMQAMRQVSRAQRKTPVLEQILVTLCMTLEHRMVKQKVFCREVAFTVHYEEHAPWHSAFSCSRPVQSGSQLMELFRDKLQQLTGSRSADTVLNEHVRAMGVSIHNFVPEDFIQCEIFDNSLRELVLRKTVYNLKERFGSNSVLRGVQVGDNVLKDVIGFGSVKDI